MDGPPHSSPQSARFGGFEIDLRTGELSRQGRRLQLQDKPFQILVSLLERPGELVTREELQERLWQDTIVDFDNNLNAAVSRLREALADSAHGPRFIETVPRKGYRFVGPPPVWGGNEPAEKVDVQVAAPARRRWPIVALGVTAIALVAIFLPRSRDAPPVTAPAGRSMLAVLPFDNLSDDPGREYLAHGMTEELLTHLGRVAPDRLGVIARTSVNRYRNSEKTIAEIGTELGVDFIVEGSVRVQGERLRIAVQLIRVSDQTHVWAESYDRDARDVLDIQNDVAIQVATAILPRLLRPGQAAEARTQSLEAFEEYLEGLFHLAAEDVPTSRRAAQHLERAVALDPDYARAWAALARARNNVWFGAEDAEQAKAISARAREAARRALELDPTLPEAYEAVAFALLYHDWDARGAAQALAQPLASAPSSIATRHLAAAAFSALGRHDEGLAVAAEALILDPAVPANRSALGWQYLFADRPTEAEARCREALEQDPSDRSGAGCLYLALIENGRPWEAVRILVDRLAREGVPRERLARVADMEPAEALRELERIRLERIMAGDENDPRAPFEAATAFTRLGELDQAFAGLEMALDRRDPRLIYLGVDPRFDPLRQDPRFGKLLRRIAPSD